MEHEEVPNNNMNPTNQPVSFYGDNSRNTDGALLAALATKDYGYNEAGMIGANGVCDLRAEVGETKWIVKDVGANVRSDIKDAESNIRRDIAKTEADIRADVLREGQENMAATKDAECNLSKEILENKYALAQAIQKAEYEAKLTAQTVIKEINEKVDREAERTNDKVDESRHFNADRFCHLENQLRDLREQSLEDKVFKLSQDLQTAKIVNRICCEPCGCESSPGNSGNN